MRVSFAKVLKKDFSVMDIDAGTAVSLKEGATYELEHADGRHPLDYYVLKGTRHGAICRYWEDAEKQGKVGLTRAAEGGDPTLDGIPLPIRSASQLTEWQMDHLVCGHLVRGKFLCERCTLKHGLVHPAAVAVYPRNIIPYSQNCQECGLQVFEIWMSRKGGPLNLFS